MTVFWSVLTVIGALGATEASAENWNEGRYAPIGIGDQLERGTVWQRGIREPEPAPIVLAEARKSAKRGASGATRTGYVDLLARELEAAILMPLDVRTPGQMEAVFERIAKDWDYSPERVTWGANSCPSPPWAVQARTRAGAPATGHRSGRHVYSKGTKEVLF